MNPEVKGKWIAALKSGNYKQGKKVLREGDNFCCLGVLCDLYSEENTDGSWKRESNYDFAYLGVLGKQPEIYTFNGLIAVLPVAVSEWAGFNDENLSVDDELLKEILKIDPEDVKSPYLEGGDSTELALVNDYGVSFEDIATLIEQVF